MWQRYARPVLGLLLIGGMLTASGCANKPTVPEYSAGTLAVTIVAGPDNSSPVAHGSKVTFKWQPTGGSGQYTFQYKIDSGSFVNVPAGQTSVIMSDPAVLTSGNHTFTIQVSDGSATATASREFIIGPVGTSDTVPPMITVTFPPAGYKLPPGSSVRFEWSVSDASNATSVLAKAGVAKLGWAVDDTSAAASWALSEDIPLTGTASNLSLGWHYLYVQAQDNGSNVTIKKDSVEVIPPTILYVNETVLEPGYSADTAPLSPADEFRRSRYFEGAVFDGFSYQEWNVAAQGYPETADIPASVKTIVWVGSGDYQNSSWGWNVGYEYTYSVATGHPATPNVLTDFIDNGGTVWITGENWLEEINVGVDNPIFEGLEYKYLGMDTLSASYGAPEVLYDFAAIKSGWPALSTDIAKLGAGLGDGGAWTGDFSQHLLPNVEPLYRVSGYETGSGSGPPPEDDWYAAWLVKDPSSGNPQVVFMGFDVYYFSADAGKAVGQKILRDLFGN